MPSLKYNTIAHNTLSAFPPRFRTLRIAGVDSTIIHNGEMYLIMLGASITNSLVDTLSKRFTLETQLANAGYQATVFDRATGGDRANTLLTKIRDNGILDPFLPYASKCLCMIHIGGNDVTSDGPYPGYATELNAQVREIAQWLADRNFNFTLSPISYRLAYASNPTEPYNTNIIQPIIQEFSPKWISGGVPIYNFYNEFVNNQNIIAGDGIHLTDPSGMDHVRTYVGNTIINNVVQKGNAPTTYLEDVIINFGSRPSEIIGAYGNISVGAYTSDKLLNTNFSEITNGTAIVASGGADNLDGRVVTDNITPTLANSGIIRRGIYGGTVTVDLSNAGLDPASNYTVRFTASRNSNTGDRWGEVTVDGITQDINAEANPPTILEWTSVNGATLASTGLVSTKKAGSVQMYMNGLHIIKE